MSKELSQKELAQQLVVAQNTISRYEGDVKNPSLEMLVAIATYFDVTTDYILGKVEL